MQISEFKIFIEYAGKSGEYIVKKFQYLNESPFYHLTTKDGTRKIEIVQQKWKITAGNPLHADSVKLIGQRIVEAEKEVDNESNKFDDFYPDQFYE